MDRINQRLAGWKGKLLNRAGRVTLAKSVLATIPVYSMQNMWLPSNVCNRIDSTVRNFIWGGNSNHWVKWSKITCTRQRGGLGIRKARECNIAMLGKHVWDMIHAPQKLWVRILLAKYLRGSHILHVTKQNGASYVWNSIFKALQYLRQGFKIRIGAREVSLWFDPWLGEELVCDLLPYVDIHDLNLKVKDIFVNGTWHFDLLHTLLPDNIRYRFMSTFVDEEAPDIWIWGDSPSGEYTARVAYKWLNEHADPGSTVSSGWSVLWKLRLPENIKFFFWMAFHDSLPTNPYRAYRH